MLKLFRFSITPVRLNKVRLLGMICLLFLSVQVSFAQSNPVISINDVTVNEGDNGATGVQFEIRLSAPSQNDISVLASTQNGTATGNVDYAAGSVVVPIPAGQTTQTLTVFVIGDTAVEGTEDFFVNLSNPVNVTIGDGQGMVTIVDDDALLLLTQPNSQRAAALDSVLFRNEPFPIANLINFSADQRTRLTIFAIGLKLAPGETASAVIATAEDSQGAVRQLPVEVVQNIPPFNFLTQVIVKLNDQLAPGDVKIRISLHGATSNAVLAQVKAQ